jgi:methylenetetrahydrofolate--tRNA-(uracil-5-)-methyltransferase
LTLDKVTIIGGGFAGVEAAWAAATRGSRVVLYEMRPQRQTAVHKTGDLAELVCSNSFKSNLLTNASGVLKEEMRRLGSLVLPIAEKHRVPAGEALAVDREPFAREVTETLEAHPNVTIVREEVCAIPPQRPLVIATGPLTSEALSAHLKELTGSDSLYFYDAVAPTVTLDSLDTTKVFRASRRGRGSGLESAPTLNTQHPTPDVPEQVGCVTAPVESADYLNCPLNKEEYMAFWEALVSAEQSTSHNPDDEKIIYFEMCVPVEELARRGPRTLAFGPMKPIGLDDPRTGRWPYAVVQLRQENKEGTLWGLVGFQTRLKWGEQKRVFRMIPGLENAEFIRYGVMHRNTYVNAPTVLDFGMQVRAHPGVFLAGQMTGVEGYLESAAIGILAGLNAHRASRGMEIVSPPRPTALGSLCHYLVETNPKHFAPMNANFGIMPELPGNIRDKREKARRKGEVALEAIDGFVQIANS